MMLSVAQILPPDLAAEYVRRLERQQLQDGRLTAGAAGQALKHNQQLVDTPESLAMSQEIGQLLQRQRELLEPLAVRSSLPFMFNCYSEGMEYKAHTDNPIMYARGAELRTDLSATLFLSAPGTYDGGELVVGVDETPVPVKLPAGSIVIYPANTLHQVRPVTRGVRWAAVTWMQSRIRSYEQRQVFRTLTQALHAIGTVPAEGPQRVAMEALLRVKDDLLRMWAA